MNLFEYIILAIIQGFTEPLPVSSSGHMKLFEMLFTSNVFLDLNYEIICNFGSFIAILIIFWKDIVKYVSDFFIYIFQKEKRKEKQKSFNFCWQIVISTIPLVITSLISKFLDLENKITSPYFLGFAFLFTAGSLYLVKNIKGNKDDEDITFKDAIIIGLFQSITFLPGISRSGATLVACLLCKLKRETSLKYTFFLYFPVSIGSVVLEAKDIFQTANLAGYILPYFLGLIIAGTITYFSYEWMSTWVKKGKLGYFAVYCLFLATFIFIYFR